MFGLPDVNNLVLSDVSSCVEGGAELNVWDDGILGSNRQIPIGKLHVWVLKTVSNLRNVWCSSFILEFPILHLNRFIHFSKHVGFSFHFFGDLIKLKVGFLYFFT
ncbi:hypothetical protein Hanom_Chr04g00313821 [Helianthus anomalus]